MERNANDFGGSTSGAGSAGSTGSFGNSNSGDVSGSMGYGAGSTGSTSGSSSDTEYGSAAGSSGNVAGTSTDAANLKDRAKDLAGNAKDKLADVGSTVRDQAGNAKNKLADALESGADKLRQRSTTGGNTLAGASSAGDVAIADGRVAQVSDKVAGGMQATADWLRDADLDNLREGIERQVKEHPGRTLLIAAGLGYLLGKAFRK